MLFLIFLILVNLSFALNCQELNIRLEKVKTYDIYVANQRTKNSLLMLQKTAKYKKKASPFVFIPTTFSCGGSGKQKGRRL